MVGPIIYRITYMFEQRVHMHQIDVQRCYYGGAFYWSSGSALVGFKRKRRKKDNKKKQKLYFRKFSFPTLIFLRKRAFLKEY